MEGLAEELKEIRESVRRILENSPRSTLSEVASNLEKDEEAVRVVMQAMYADGEIRPLYVYEIGRAENG